MAAATVTKNLGSILESMYHSSCMSPFKAAEAGINIELTHPQTRKVIKAELLALVTLIVKSSGHSWPAIH